MIILNKYQAGEEDYFIERMVYAARVDGSIRTIEFWENAILTPFVNRDSLLERLILIFPILEEYFPNNWDIGWDIVAGGLLPSLIIYFPEVTITNDNGKQHLIQGLGMILKFRDWSTWDEDDDGEYPDDYLAANIAPVIYGFRTHKTFIEQLRGYQHSHLPSISYASNPMYPESSFCLGSSEILNVFANLDDAITDEDFKMTFEALCLMLRVHAETESKEGGPYIHIDSLVGVSRERWYNNSVSVYESLVSYILRENISLGFDYAQAEGGFVIKNNPKYHQRLKELLVLAGLDHLVLVSEDEEGRQYTFSPVANLDTIRHIQEAVEHMNIGGQKTFTYIHGRKIELEVAEPVTEEDNTNYKIAKEFVSYAKRKIEERINTRFIKNKGIESHNKAILERIHNGENPVLMYQDK